MSINIFHDDSEHDEQEIRLERIEIKLLRDILEELKHIDRVVSYPRLSAFQVQYLRRVQMPTPGPVTLTAVGQQVTAVIANAMDQFGQPWTGEIPAATFSDDNPAAATTDPSTGVVTAVANGQDSVGATLTNSAGAVITGTPLVVIVDIPAPVPVLSSFEVQTA
jgi:hypothetical protein